jgi:quercetin dioxygenase-like cupin family protein
MDSSHLATLHLHSKDIPWVDFGDGANVRILHARPSEDFVVTEILANPGWESKLHRHLRPVFGWTLDGRWGHDRTYEYRPGTYIFETPGVIHKFYGGDKPVNAVFVSYGSLEFIDENTREVIQSLAPEMIVKQYMEACEKTGVGRPNILS